jgi:uncharacterized protein YaaN involved in tellurite resistance
MSTVTTTTDDAGATGPERQSLARLLDIPAADLVNDPALAKQADQVVDQLVTREVAADPVRATDVKAALQTMAAELQKQSAYRSQMLKQPVKKLYQETEQGGEVANALVDLKLKVEELDPGQFDFEAGWMTRTLGRLPFVGSPLKRYFSKYESASTVMDAIIRSLKNGREQLNRDNLTLVNDQKEMRELNVRLEAAIKLGQLIDQRLAARLEAELAADDPKRAFVQSEWLFPLRQRIQDLQQQLAVNQQAIMAIEMIVRNNHELMRGVDRAVNVTVSALQVAVTLALALANQKIVLDKVQAVNETTDKLIAGTAERLRTQGAEIHKQAASTQLNIDTLKKAFADIRAAIDDVTRFRQEALPKMAEAIIELDKLTSDAKESIATMDAASRARESLGASLGRVEP